MTVNKWFRKVIYIITFCGIFSFKCAIAHEFNINNYKYRLHEPLRKLSEKFKIKIKKEIIKERSEGKLKLQPLGTGFERKRILRRLFPVNSYKVKKIYYSKSGPVIISGNDSLKKKTDAFNTIAAENNFFITKENIIGYIKDYIYLTHDYKADYATVMINEQSTEDIRNAINRNYNMKISFDVNTEDEKDFFYEIVKIYMGVTLKYININNYNLYFASFIAIYFVDETLSFKFVKYEIIIDINGIIYPLECDLDKL